MRYVVSFVMFWYDFIVGDCWELAAGVVAALVVVAIAISFAPDLSSPLGPALAVVVMGMLGGSLWLEWARQAARR